MSRIPAARDDFEPGGRLRGFQENRMAVQDKKDDKEKELFGDAEEKLFHKLVRVRTWDTQPEDERKDEDEPFREGPARDGRVLQTIARLARDPTAFKPAMQEIEAGARFDAQEPSMCPLTSSVTQEEWEHLYAAVMRSKPLRTLFASAALPLSEADARAVATLAQLADITPDEDQMLSTQDGPFTYILRQNFPTPGILLLDFLAKFLSLYRADAALAERLAGLAEKPYWQTVLASIEEGDDYTEGPDSEAGRYLAAWRNSLDVAKAANLRTLLGGRLPLSQTLAELVALVWSRRVDLDETKKEATTLIRLGPTQGKAEVEQTDDKRWSALALERLRRNEGARLADVEYTLCLRSEVAKRLIEVRKIAKVETLRYRWPDAARLALANRESIKEVERHVIRRKQNPDAPELTSGTTPKFSSDEATDLYNLSEKDRQFTRFLRLRPLFADIPLFKYLSASPLPSAQQQPQQQTPPQTTQTQTPTKTATPQAEETATTAATMQPERVTAAWPAPLDGYQTFVFRITPGDDEPESRVRKYAVKITFPNHMTVSGDVGISLLELGDNVLSALGVLHGPDAEQHIQQMFAQKDTEYMFRLARAGQLLLDKFFGSLLRSAVGADDTVADVLRNTAAADAVRVVIETEDEGVANFAWEWLSFPGERDILIRSERHSLVRSSPKKNRATERRLTPPLRVLAAAPSYNNSMRGETVSRLKRLLSGPLSTGVVTQELAEDNVTTESLAAAFSRFNPHVLHFEGQITSDLDAERVFSRALFLSSLGPEMKPLPLPQALKLLDSSGVQLLLFMPSPFVTSPSHYVLQFISGLVEGALPAAVAPVSAVDDATVQKFTDGFYRALVLEGLELEAAVSKARCSLIGEGGDWTAFTLFSDLETLRTSRVIPDPRLE